MLVGVPKEIKDHEYRVGLIPSTVRELVSKGHRVLAESGAGHGAQPLHSSVELIATRPACLLEVMELTHYSRRQHRVRSRNPYQLHYEGLSQVAVELDQV